MAFRYGFYNSVNHDRRYDARDFSRLFSGILNDGVFMNYGDHFAVKPRSGLTVILGTGLAWFSQSWSCVDAPMVITMPAAESSVYKRTDAIVLDVWGKKSVRQNRILVVKGSRSGSHPPKPTLIRDDADEHWQYALAYITLEAGQTTITAANIENYVGKGNTPYSTGLMPVHNVDAIWSQWENEFRTWMNKLQGIISGDVAGNIINQLQRVQNGANLYRVSVTDTFYEPDGSTGNNFSIYYGSSNHPTPNAWGDSTTLYNLWKQAKGGTAVSYGEMLSIHLEASPDSNHLPIRGYIRVSGSGSSGYEPTPATLKTVRADNIKAYTAEGYVNVDIGSSYGHRSMYSVQTDDGRYYTVYPHQFMRNPGTTRSLEGDEEYVVSVSEEVKEPDGQLDG